MKERRPKTLGLNTVWLVLNPVGESFGPVAGLIQNTLVDDAFAFTLFPYEWIFPPKTLILDMEAGSLPEVIQSLQAYPPDTLSHAILLGEPGFDAWSRRLVSVRRGFPTLQGVLTARPRDWLLAFFDSRATIQAVDRAETDVPDWSARVQTLVGLAAVAFLTYLWRAVRKRETTMAPAAASGPAPA